MAVTEQSNDVHVAAVRAENTADPGEGADGANAAGVRASSKIGEGVHAETTNASFWSAVAGFALNPAGTGSGVHGESQGKGVGVRALAQQGPGVIAHSEGGEGVHGETNSPLHWSAVAGFANNPQGTGSGVHGESQGKGAGVRALAQQGPGVFAQSQNIGVFAKGGQFAGVFEGNIDVSGNISVGGDVILRNADCAEDFDIAPAAQAEPGTVMIIDESGALKECAAPYDSRVAGVISGAGHYKPGIRLDQQQDKPGRKPLALLGKVFCKVDASLGAIAMGDLLTTAPTPGHAMKAGDRSRAAGATLGKALRPLKEGQGLIPILVALH